MKCLDKKATGIFLSLIKDLEDPTEGENSNKKLDSENGFMPVHIERIGKYNFSIAHYGKQNGDLMRDPEMVFHEDHGKIYPIYWRNDYVGLEQFSATIKGDIWEVKPKMQADHTKFANTWMRNIEKQQNL